MASKEIVVDPRPEMVQEFCLEQLFPQFLFCYKPNRQLPDNEALQLCTIVLTGSPSNFILQMDADRRTSDRMSADMSSLYGSERRGEFVVTDQFLHPGVPVAARYFSADDLRWYRAIIVEVDRTPGKEKPVRIRFVDYGNHQQNEPFELKMLPAEMGDEPPLSIKSRLEGTAEGEDYERPVKDNFRTWVNQSLKDHRCLVHFKSFDAAAIQHVVNLYNAHTGEKYVLPPGGRIPLVAPEPSGNTTSTVDDLIKLDDSASGGGASACIPTPPKVSKFNEDLKTVFGSMAVSGPAATTDRITGAEGALSSDEEEEEPKPKPETAEKEVQTDVTLLDLEEAEEEEFGDSASGGPDAPYDPFTDPQYKDLVEKFPNLMTYLKMGDPK